jgi:hypothetical protein
MAVKNCFALGSPTLEDIVRQGKWRYGVSDAVFLCARTTPHVYGLSTYFRIALAFSCSRSCFFGGVNGGEQKRQRSFSRRANIETD